MILPARGGQGPPWGQPVDFAGASVRMCTSGGRGRSISVFPCDVSECVGGMQRGQAHVLTSASGGNAGVGERVRWMPGVFGGQERRST
jgi:hypothetical protein